MRYFPLKFLHHRSTDTFRYGLASSPFILYFGAWPSNLFQTKALFVTELNFLFRSQGKNLWDIPTIFVPKTRSIIHRSTPKRRDTGNFAQVFRMKTEWVRFRMLFLWGQMINRSRRHKRPQKQRYNIQDEVWIHHGPRGHYNPQYRHFDECTDWIWYLLDSGFRGTRRRPLQKNRYSVNTLNTPQRLSFKGWFNNFCPVARF